MPGCPLVLIHGFTQSGRSWDTLRPGLGERSILALDAPGHGRAAGVRAGLAQGADLLAAEAPAPADWLGYSMGGRFALHVALRHPERIRKLVLASATGGIDDPLEREERRRSDGALALRVEAEGPEAFLRFWLSQPMFARVPGAGDEVAQRSQNATAAGLASSLRLAGTGTQEPLWDRLGALTMPVLVVTGSLDVKFTALGDRLAAAIGANAERAVIADAGHACHLERPDLFVRIVTAFLDS